MSAAAQIWHRVRLLVAQGVGTLIGADVVQATVLDGETLPKVRRVEPYGLSYRPKPGCEVYMVFPGGDRAHGIALVIGDRRYQMNLVEGEVALHDDEGNYVKLGRGGVATVKAATEVVVDAPLVRTAGDLQVAGALTVAGGMAVMGGAQISGALLHDGVSVGHGHTHTTTVNGSPTSDVNR